MIRGKTASRSSLKLYPPSAVVNGAHVVQLFPEYQVHPAAM